MDFMQFGFGFILPKMPKVLTHCFMLFVFWSFLFVCIFFQMLWECFVNLEEFCVVCKSTKLKALVYNILQPLP